MSYILDALKRAEVERERGSVPGLHTRTAVSYAEVDDASSLPWVWLLAAAVLVVAGGAGFWWWRAPAPQVPATKPTPIAISPTTEVPLAVAALPPTQPLARATPAPVVIQFAQPAQAPATASSDAVVAAGPTQRVAKPAPTSKPKPGPTIAAPSNVAAVAPIAAPAPVAKVLPAAVAPLPQPMVVNPPRVAAPPTGAGIPMLSELPDALRRQIPPLTISGAVYSEDPSQRMLLVNNQTFGPGNTVAPGLQLEEIQSSSSIFNFQGTRFQLGH
jgi:general secretion pathway protein B